MVTFFYKNNLKILFLTDIIKGKLNFRAVIKKVTV